MGIGCIVRCNARSSSCRTLPLPLFRAMTIGDAPAQGNRPATELPSAAIRALLSDRAPLLAARGAPPERLRAQLPLPADDVVRAEQHCLSEASRQQRRFGNEQMYYNNVINLQRSQAAIDCLQGNDSGSLGTSPFATQSQTRALGNHSRNRTMGPAQPERL